MVGPLTPLLLSFAAAHSLAVVDLSSSKQPAMEEALRRAPGVKAMPGRRTHAAVDDAASLGLVCTIEEQPCLEKLQVLLRVDEVLAFSVDGATLSVLDVGGSKDGARRARVHIGNSASAAAAAAWQAVRAPPPEVVEVKPPPAHVEPPPDAGPPPPHLEDQPPSAPATTPTATSGGVSPALATAVVGGVVAVGCGIGAVATSADLANKLKAAQAGRRPLDERYYSGTTLFWVLTGCTAVGLGGTVAGGVLTGLE